MQWDCVFCLKASVLCVFRPRISVVWLSFWNFYGCVFTEYRCITTEDRMWFGHRIVFKIIVRIYRVDNGNQILWRHRLENKSIRSSQSSFLRNRILYGLFYCSSLSSLYTIPVNVLKPTRLQSSTLRIDADFFYTALNSNNRPICLHDMIKVPMLSWNYYTHGSW